MQVKQRQSESSLCSCSLELSSSPSGDEPTAETRANQALVCPGLAARALMMAG